ncbi:hypothetical protein Tco_1464875 [Tanacetum coccineum]
MLNITTKQTYINEGSQRLPKASRALRSLPDRKRSEGLEKGYDRFQQLLSQLEAHGAEVSTEDQIIKFSDSLPRSKHLDFASDDLEQIDDVDIKEMDINWQIAMIAIRMKKFYKKTRRRVKIDGNKPVGQIDGKKRDSFYQDKEQERNKQETELLLTMDDGVVN